MQEKHSLLALLLCLCLAGVFGLVNGAVADGIQINCGGPAVGTFVADTDFSGGTASAGTTDVITTTGLTNPAPLAVYQKDRNGTFSYTIPSLTPGGSYVVRLHFAETYWTSAGQRLFNVSINGQSALSNFDIFAVAGGQDIAVIEQFPATANSSGTITLACTTVVDHGKINGIEVLPATASTGEIHFYPRTGSASLMVGAKFQGSSDGINYTDLYTITSTPTDSAWTIVPLAFDPSIYRYLRYLSPAGSYGNVAEVAFYTGTGAGAVKINGIFFGTGSGNSFLQGEDGDPVTYFNGTSANGNYVGLDQQGQQLSLTAAGVAAGFSLTTFATGFPYTPNSIGPLSVVFPGSTVLVSDSPGNLRVFPTDADNQVAGSTSPAVVPTATGTSCWGMEMAGGVIYLAQKEPGKIVCVHNDGTVYTPTSVVASVPLATGIAANPVSGDLFVTDNGDTGANNGAIYDVNPQTGTATAWPQALNKPDGIKITPDGTTLYVATDNDIQSFNIAGKSLAWDYNSVSGHTPLTQIDSLALGYGSLSNMAYIDTHDGNLWQIALPGGSVAPGTATLIASGGTRGDFITPDPHGQGSLLIAQTDRLLRLSLFPPLGSSPLALSSLTVNPGSVVGGKSGLATVTLTGPAPTGGATVTLSSSNVNASVPTSVTIAPGNRAATFVASTTAVSAPTIATLSATFSSLTLPTPLLITGTAELSLKLAPTSVVGGTTSQGTVTLSNPAPSGGALIHLSSDSTAAGVTVPPNVMVAAGAKTATFTVTTLAVGTTVTAMISAVGANSTTAALLTVTPPTLTGLTLNPSSVTGGDYSTGTVTLGSPAPAGGLRIGLSSDKAAATVPVTAVIAGGATSGTFPISTSVVSTGVTANISGTFNSVTQSAALMITPPVIVVTPGNAVVQTSATQQFTAAAQDQSGRLLANQPTFTWSVVSGGVGSINSSGLYTAGTTTGTATVMATALGQSGTAAVTVETAVTQTTPLTLFTTVNATDWKMFGYGGMRGVGTGTIVVTGLSGPVTKAYLYWHSPTESRDPTVNATVTFNGNNVTGSNIGFSASHCGDDASFLNLQAYRADVTSFVTGNNNYSLSNFLKFVNGSEVADINGVTLVVFYNDGDATNNRDVKMFDGNDDNADGANTWDDTFSNINYVAGTNANLWLCVGLGQSYLDGAISINNSQLLPSGNNFDGNSVPQGSGLFSGSGVASGLWDIHSYSNLAQFLTPGNNSLHLVSPYADDCLSLIIAIVDQPSAGSGSGSGGSLPPSPPTIVPPGAAASPSPVTGTTTNLSVLGADANGENNLAYTWQIVGTPPSPVFLSLNGTNAAKNTVATFTQAGTYLFQVSVQNASGLTATSTVSVTVNQTLSSLTLTPATASLPLSGTQQFTPVMTDQFGTVLSSPPTVTWSVVSGGVGTINTSGLYSAGTTNGAATVQAVAGSLTATASVTVASTAPTVTAPGAKATPNPVTGTTTTLSVTANDDGGEPNLTYTWATTGTPPAAVTFSANGTNAAKTSVATFTKAGSYTFQVVIRDVGGLTATSSVTVTVNQTLTAIAVSPASVTLSSLATQQFSANATDQFGAALSPQPAFTWSLASGVGSVSSSGLYTASAAAGTATVKATSGSVSGTASVTVAVSAPTIVPPGAVANPNPVTGTTTTLSVLGADAAGEPNLTYTWATTGTPPAAVTYSLNGTNAAKTTVATFTKAGSYTFQVTVRNPGGLTVTSSVTVTVNQTLTTISVTPATVTLHSLGTQQFAASALDQFGAALSPQPTFTWSVDSGGAGSVSSSGLYTASASAGSATVRATSGGLSGTASVTVANAAPTITTPPGATASPNPVTATTTALSVTAGDDAGESALTYTWATTGTPPAAVTYSVNGTNAAKTSVATFTKAGSYTFQVTVKDAAGLSATSSVTVTVNQTLTTISVTPASLSLQTGTTRQFAASGLDQFGTALSSQPSFTWSVVSGGVGSISASGLYTAGSTAGSATVKATSGSVSGTAAVTVTVAVPVLTSITVTPTPVSVNINKTQQFTATALDQNGKPLVSQPSLTWSLASGVGTVSGSGLYTAPTSTGSASVKAASGSVSGTASVTVTNASAPTIATAAFANPSPVPGTTTTLTVKGADVTGESNLIYTWATTGTPPAAVAFSVNGTNAAKTSVAAFTKAGSYTFQVTVQNGAGLTVTSSVTVTVNQTLTAISVTPATAALSSLGTQQFSASASDQFGAALSPQPTFTWSVDSGGKGTVSSSGLYTASASAGSATVRATSGGVSGTASVTVANAAPTVTPPGATANPNPVTGTTTTLFVTATDDGNEPNLIYTWATTGTPPAAVTYSVNGTNAAKSTVATFTKAGSYTFQVTVKDAGGATATSSVTVTVNQTVTAISVAPASVTLPTGGVQQFTASATDQFGTALSTQPAVAWTVSSGGTIGSANGTFTAGTATGGPFTVTATSAGVSGTASVTLVASIPIATPVISIGGGAGSATVTITDGTPKAVLFYTLDGSTPTSASLLYQGPFVVTSTTTIKAVAYLSVSHSAVATATATVTSGSGGSVPGVAITSPTDSFVEMGNSGSPLIPIIGSVSGSSLSTWTLAYRPVSGDDGDGGTWIPISAGTTAQAAGSTLGSLDPTLMLNGLYQIQLTAYNTTGQSNSAMVTILIKGDQKVGYFTLSYNDLTVPVSGLPITITRTYDSRNKGLGDFGTGWTLSTSNVKVQKADTLGLDWTEVSSGYTFQLVANQSHLITITFPNGDTYNFVPYIAPSIGDSYENLGGTLTYAAVGPVQGAMLVGKNNPNGIPFVALSLSGGGNAVGVELDGTDDDLDDSGFPIDENEFILTLRNGKQFDVTIDGGLQSIRDLNGNTVTFTPNGIYSSSYSYSTPIVRYQRTNGLISKITGPSGIPLTYTQTGTDLTGFTDRANNLSTYDYDYSHDLTGIHDPRGLQPLRNDYDASGRLIDSVDADQNMITYSYDLMAHKQTVLDRLGHETDFAYDYYGNVTSKTQYLSDGTPVITTDAFTDSNNPDKKTQETDPLGRITQFVYFPTGELQTVTQQRLNGGQPVTTSYTYNNFGEVLTVLDANANNQGTTNYAATNTYDTDGNLSTTQDALGNTTHYYYNQNGTPSHVTDANGKPTYYFYDSGANYPAGAYVTRVQDALGHTTAFDYDPDGNKIKQVQNRTNAGGGTDTLVTGYQYDADDRLTMTVFPDSTLSVPDTAQTIYNSLGKVDHTIDPLGRTTYYKYDTQGRQYETDYPDSTKTSTTYDLNGQRLTSTDRAGRISGYVYDTLGRLTQSGPIDSSGHWLTDSGGNPIYSQTSYDKAGQTLTETDENNNVTTYTYDDLGRKATVKDAIGNFTYYNDATDSGYDLNGNQIKVKDARGNLTKFQYDLDNRLLETDLYKADGITLLTSTKTSYDALGRRYTSTDGAAGVNADPRTTTYNYDEVGRLKTVMTNGSHTETYGYDEIGEKVSQTDANSHTTKFAYDFKGHLVKKTLPALQFMTMGYNLDGTIATQTDYNGTTTNFTYEPLTGRLSYKLSSTGQWVGYDYYADGSRHDAYRGHGTVSLASADSTLTNTYDALGRLQTVQTPTGLLTYGYDRAGNKTSLASPSGTTTYDYDADNRLWHVTHKTGGTTTYGYDANGNRQSLTLPSSTGIVTSYTYDEANRLTLLTNKKGATTLSSYAYALYASGKRQSVTDATGGKVTYAYDADGRMTGETSTGLTPAIANTYAYDGVGNRTSLNGGATITYDADDRLTTAGHSYDANGNETTVNGQLAAYDFENHLLTVGSTNSYTYDADGNRLSATTSSGTTSYLVDTNTAFARVLEEYSGASLSARYDYGDDLLRMDRTLPSASTSYYLYDGLGSTRQLVNASGTVTDSYLYDAYGVGLAHSPNSGIVNQFLFQGQQFDTASNDYYQRARYYDPTIGRFLSQDPFGGSTNDPISLHRYLYASDDPANRIDPSGKDDLVEILAVDAIQTQLIAGEAGVSLVEGAEGIVEVGDAAEEITAGESFAADIAEVEEGGGIFGEGPVQHFTNAEGVQGITGINPDELEIGQTVRVPKLSFGESTNPFLAGEDGATSITEVGPNATPGQLNQIGVFGDKQNFVIQFSRESGYANNIRVNPVFPSRSIFSIPKGSTFDASDYIYTVTRVR